jgi:adenylate cyclase
VLRRLVDHMLSFGSYPGEPDSQRGKRRIIVAAIWMASILTVPTALGYYSSGYTWVALANTAVVLLAAGILLGLDRAPHRFGLWVKTMFTAVFLLLAFESTMKGGLVPSGLTALSGLIIVVGCLIAFGVGSAMRWFGAFVLLIIYAVLIPNFVDAPYIVEDPTIDVALSIITTAIVILAVMIYFVRQRDRFQKESDDLLHNILPDEIAARLKASSGMIADSYESASVLFADVVDFTPMSARMSAHELVGLLNHLFSKFDRFVEELGLEKIKTVGDEYMVASGIPTVRPDHASAIADLALRIRDELVANPIDGHHIEMRIGINSGPVVAGIIGTNKFAYDLWGDVVNTASRMESEGLEGSIQISEATYHLIKDQYLCQARGEVHVKGKGLMPTYLLLSHNAQTAPIGARE